jgi:hypothetical protein
VGVRNATAIAVLVLSAGTPGQPSFLHRADPATLRFEGVTLRLPGLAFGYAWARRGATLAVVTKPTGGMGFPVRLVALPALEVVGSVAVGTRDVCGLTFRGSTLVALTADQPCYRPGGRFSILRIDVGARRVTSVRDVPGLHVAAPTNLAFGDGRAFVAGADGAVDSVELVSGTTSVHRPRRALAKGADVVPTAWFGGNLLGVGDRVVDVRTWRTRVLEPGARGVVRAGGDLAEYGPRGVAVYTRSGRFLFRPIADPVTAGVTATGGRLYAGGEVVDLASRSVRPAPAGLAFVLAR